MSGRNSAEEPRAESHDDLESLFTEEGDDVDSLFGSDVDDGPASPFTEDHTSEPGAEAAAEAQVPFALTLPPKPVFSLTLPPRPQNFVESPPVPQLTLPPKPVFSLTLPPRPQNFVESPPVPQLTLPSLPSEVAQPFGNQDVSAQEHTPGAEGPTEDDSEDLELQLELELRQEDQEIDNGHTVLPLDPGPQACQIDPETEVLSPDIGGREPHVPLPRRVDLDDVHLEVVARRITLKATTSLNQIYDKLGLARKHGQRLQKQVKTWLREHAVSFAFSNRYDPTSLPHLKSRLVYTALLLLQEEGLGHEWFGPAATTSAKTTPSWPTDSTIILVFTVALLYKIIRHKMQGISGSKRRQDSVSNAGSNKRSNPSRPSSMSSAVESIMPKLVISGNLDYNSPQCFRAGRLQSKSSRQSYPTPPGDSDDAPSPDASLMPPDGDGVDVSRL